MLVSTMELTSSDIIHFHMLLGKLVPDVKDTTKLKFDIEKLEYLFYQLIKKKLSIKENIGFKITSYSFEKYIKSNEKDYKSYIFKTYSPNNPTPCFLSKEAKKIISMMSKYDNILLQHEGFNRNRIKVDIKN